MFLHTAYIQKKVYQLQNHHFSVSRFCVFWIPRHTLPGLISIKRNAIFGIHQASRTRFPNLISHRLSTIINRQWWFSRPSVEWLVFYWGVMKKGQFFLSQHDMKSLPCLRMSVLSHCCLFKKKLGGNGTKIPEDMIFIQFTSTWKAEVSEKSGSMNQMNSSMLMYVETLKPTKIQGTCHSLVFKSLPFSPVPIL